MKEETNKNIKIHKKKLNIKIKIKTKKILPSYYNNSQFKLKIKKSTIKKAGLGVFTLEEIPPNTFIGLYEGKQSTAQDGIYYFEITEDFGIDAQDYPRCYMAMINDVYKTNKIINCEFLLNEEEKRIEIWSGDKLINEGDELFASYGDKYW